MKIEILESRIAPAMVITVATLSDSSSSPKLTLRAAIAEAGAGDTIIFAQGLHGAIKLSSPLVINTGITIDGLSTPGKASVGKVVDGTSHNLITLDGGGKFEILDVLTSTAFAINNLNLTGGNSAFGGALYSNDSNGVSINGCTFSKNKAPGVSGFAGDAGSGGAIYARRGEISLVNSKLSGNGASGGGGESTGGIGAGGAVYLAPHASGFFSTDSFTGNAATGGAGITASGGAGIGGAIYSIGGDFSVHSSTFSGNVAIGGKSSGNYISAEHVGAGGGSGGAVYGAAGSTIGLYNSTFKGNAARGGDGLAGAKGASGTVGNTGAHGANGGYAGYAAGGAVSGRGPFTVFDCVLTGNLALGGKGGAGGAGGNGGAGHGSIKPGLGANGGNGAYGGDSYGGAISIRGSTSSLVLTESTISGNLAKPGASGKGGSAGAGAHSSTPPTRGANGKSGISYGGGITSENSTNLNLAGDIVSSNGATYGGGLQIYAPKTGAISYSTISSNRAVNGGGINIYGNNDAAFVIGSSTISGNKASVSGGGIYAFEQSVTLQQITVANNSAAKKGGGLLLNSNSNKIENSTIAFNKASTGGGVYASGYYDTTFFSSVISNNSLFSGKKPGINRGTDVYGYINATYSAFGVSSDVTISNGAESDLLADASHFNFYLEPLHNNGGSTETILFQDTKSHTSALLDSGSNTMGNFNYDQRGSSSPTFVRSQGATDIGAVEVGS